jgi:hypothetical protein
LTGPQQHIELIQRLDMFCDRLQIEASGYGEDRTHDRLVGSVHNPA